MKQILCLSLLIASNAFAIDFQKVTGTFDVKTQKEIQVGHDTVAQAAYGSFDMNEASRFPASVAPEVEKTHSVGVQELTGTFNAR